MIFAGLPWGNAGREKKFNAFGKIQEGGGTKALAAALLDQGCRGAPLDIRRNTMLGWAVTFLVIALIAAALGFGGIAGASVGIAKILFFVFIVLFVIAMIARAMQGKKPL